MHSEERPACSRQAISTACPALSFGELQGEWQMPKKEDNREPKVGEAKLVWTGLVIRSLIPGSPDYRAVRFTPAPDGGLPERLRKAIQKYYEDGCGNQDTPAGRFIAVVKKWVDHHRKQVEPDPLPIEIELAKRALEKDFPEFLNELLYEDDYREARPGPPGKASFSTLERIIALLGSLAIILTFLLYIYPEFDIVLTWTDIKIIIMSLVPILDFLASIAALIMFVYWLRSPQK